MTEVTREIRITKLALAEMDAAFGWLCERSPRATRKWYQQLRQAIDLLTNHRQGCPLAPENDHYRGELRQWLNVPPCQAFRIIFENRGSHFVIVRVRHSVQDLLREEDW